VGGAIADTPITTDDVQWMVLGAVIAVLAVVLAMVLRDRVAERRAAERMERRLLDQLEAPPAPVREPDWPLVRGCNCTHARAVHVSTGCTVGGCRCQGVRV
jgi:hypothetical protein